MVTLLQAQLQLYGLEGPRELDPEEVGESTVLPKSSSKVDSGEERRRLAHRKDRHRNGAKRGKS